MINNRKMHEPLPHSFSDVMTAIADRNKPVVTKLPAKPFVKWVGGK